MTGGSVRLWLPRNPAGNPLHQSETLAISAPYMVLTALSELEGKALTLEEIIKVVKTLPKIPALKVISGLGTILANTGYSSVKDQLGLANQLLNPNLYSKVRTLVQQGQRYVFSEPQLLLLFGLILVYGGKNRTNPEPSDDGQQKVLKFETLGRLLLGVNDLINEEWQTAEAVEASLGPDPKLERSLIRSQLSVYHEDLAYIFARYYLLLFKIPESYRSRNHPNRVPVRRLFHQATGVRALDYHLATFGAFSWFKPIDVTKIQENLNRFSIDTKSFFKNLASPKAARQALSLIQASMTTHSHGFKKAFKSSVSPAYPSVLVRQKPLCLLGRRRLVPLLVGLLQERIATGIYWAVRDHIYPSGGTPAQKQASQDFLTYFGSLFEQYVEARLTSIYGKPSGSLARWWTPRQYLKKSDQSNPPTNCDVIIEQPSSLVLLETKAHIVNLKTKAEGSIGSFTRDLNQSVYVAAKQLDKAVSNLRAGKYKSVPQRHRLIFPMVVTLDPIPMNPLTRLRINKYLADNNLLKQDGVQPLAILSAEELEILEPLLLSGLVLETILKLHAQTPRLQGLPFIYSIDQARASQSPRPRNENLLKVLHELMYEVRHRGFPGQA